MSDSNTSRVPRDSLRIWSVERPGWHVSPGKVPDPGEWICCVEGPAEVLRVLGKTSDGSRLLELRFESRPQPFFASSSNIMFRSDEVDPRSRPDPLPVPGDL